MTDLQEHESHCYKCFNFKNCIKLNLSKSNETRTTSCPIVECRFKCNAQFHSCKEDEHILLCQNIKVSCLNGPYGCPVVLERKYIAQHLQTCPASVVVCKVEWNRWPLGDKEKRPFELEGNSEQLDVAFLQNDEKTSIEWKKNLPKKLRQTLRTALTEKNPVMPLGVSGHRIPYCIVTENLIEKLTGSSINAVNSEHSDQEESSSSHGQIGLQASVCKKLFSMSDSNNNSNSNGDKLKSQMVMKNAQTIPNNFEQQTTIPSNETDNETISANNEDHVPTTKLGIVVDTMPRSRLKPKNIYSFMCAHEFRRDEYADHFRQVHSQISTAVNGWIFRRCPMETLGCTFGLDRLLPHSDKNHRIIHNKVTFCTTQVVSSISPNNEFDVNGEIKKSRSLCDMPFEILIILTRYLDPLSLGNLSLTCTRLREVAEFVVEKRGLVVLQWEKTTSGSGWEICSKKWLFSTAFSPINKWSFNTIGTISNHMKTCPYFERNVRDEPFNYGAKEDDL